MAWVWSGALELTHAPDLDIYAVNSYGGIAVHLATLEASAYDKPVLLTEFGRIGYFEAPIGWNDIPDPVQAEEIVNHWNVLNDDFDTLGGCVFAWIDKAEPGGFFGWGITNGNGVALPQFIALSKEWGGVYVPPVAGIAVPAIAVGKKIPASGQRVTVVAKNARRKIRYWVQFTNRGETGTEITLNHSRANSRFRTRVFYEGASRQDVTTAATTTGYVQMDVSADYRIELKPKKALRSRRLTRQIFRISGRKEPGGTVVDQGIAKVVVKNRKK